MFVLFLQLNTVPGQLLTIQFSQESRETSYSLVKQQVWAKPLINKYKEVGNSSACQ